MSSVFLACFRFVEIDGTTHFVGRRRREAIVAYSVAFMNRFLKGDRAASLLRHPAEP